MTRPHSTLSVSPSPARRHRWTRAFLVGYVALLGASTLVRTFTRPQRTLGADERVVMTHPAGDHGTPGIVRISYREYPVADSAAPVVVTLHGSPGDNSQVAPVSRSLSSRFRVIAPDLPGFGASTHEIPDYSVASHARYVFQLLDSLHVDRVHVVGYSMGGGVALEMAAREPERVSSIVLVSAIGVQEYELLGDYLLNRALHGLQLAGLWGLRELTPHFGWMDDAFLGVEYARNFYDTDQRPLRGILERWPGPMLIVQGSGDGLVPPSIAQEHGRIVPQSEVQMWDGGHFMVFTQGRVVGDSIAKFVDRVERGTATTRATATPERLQRAAEPFDPSRIPKPVGFSLLILLLLLAASTLVSEDLACIAAGLLVSRGTIAFLPATIACLIGIAGGDMLLFLAGRVLGRPALRHAPLRWFVTEEDVERSSRWFREKGLRLVLATRFMPGTRMPTYVAAGVLRTHWFAFSVAFLVASSVWTPLLVGSSALIGGPMMDWIVGYQRVAGWIFVLGLLTIFLLVRTGVALSTWRGRRLLLSRWRRLTRWEFWPVWAVYPPVALSILWQCMRYKSLTVFTAANPAIPAGGLVGESKAGILAGLGKDGRVASFVLLQGWTSAEEGAQEVRRFMSDTHLDYPVVLKPDIGERGSGVAIVHSDSEVRAYLQMAGSTVLVQEYVPGVEFGVFYFRFPGQESGTVFSITEKRFPTVVGDGHRTVETLILSDDRAVCSARRFLRDHVHRLDEILVPGEALTLTRLGTHRLGAIFLDGAKHATPALREALDAMSRQYDGFWFGRYDLRAATVADLEAGLFRVVELNGISSEAAHIYDPRYSLFDAWRTLVRQWKLAFEIGSKNVALGARPASLREIATLVRRHANATKRHADPRLLRQHALSGEGF